MKHTDSNGSHPQPALPVAFDSALIEPRKKALVAVSGGRDSVALLHLLVSAGHRKLVVCHLNHGLRGRESGQDAQFVRRLAARLGLDCEVERAEVALKANGKSIETLAREARHEFFGRMARKHRTPRVFLAHHAEDQAETILANLCRGTGITGLAGMKASQPMGDDLLLLRPMLQMRRAEIDAYVKQHRLSFREDSSNQSDAHRRNRLRHEVLPLLNDVFLRDVTPLILRCGMLAGRDADMLTFEGQQMEEVLTMGSDDWPELDLCFAHALHPAISSRVLAIWLRDHLKLPGIEFAHIEAAMAMTKPDGPAKMNLPGGWHLRRKAKRLFVVSEPPKNRAPN